MNVRTSQFFHQYSKRFNEIYGNENNFLNKLINKYFRKSMRLRFEYVFRNSNDFNNSSVLDVGCGCGAFLEYFNMKMVPKIVVLGRLLVVAGLASKS